MGEVINEKREQHSKAIEALKRLKEKERDVTFHRKRLNSKTVVYCKNEDRIEDFTKAVKNLKSTIVHD